MPAPNILFFLLDDMGWKDLACYGSTFYETPNIDRLAKEGLRFTDAYASCPVCSPTRASVLTGKYPARVGITNYIPGNATGKLAGVPYFHQLPLTERSIAHALKDGGYQTWHVGKWHLGKPGRYPEDFGFDVNVGGCEWGAPRDGYFSPWNFPNLPRGDHAGQYLTDYLTDRAADLLRDRDADRPFFMHFAHYAVHTPIEAPADLIDKYERKAEALGLDRQRTFVSGGPHPCLHKKDIPIQRRVIQSHPAYAAMIENLDRNVGRLLDLLDELGLADNTLVVFTSDNGGLSTSEGSPTCNFPLAEGKGWMYDGGVREPLLVRWPCKVGAGRVTDALATSTDFYPTFLEAAGLPLEPEQHADGVSLLPALTDGSMFDRGPIFWHYPHYSNQGGSPGCSVRDGDWKLIEFFEDGRLELYNLRDDLQEEHDLAATHTQRVEDLHAKLVAWREEVEALIPGPNPDYEDQLLGRRPVTNDAERLSRPLPVGG
ncbi:MAG: sulfatase [Planctomycetota bacterium]